MRVVIATVRVPFVFGGAEVLAEGLRQALVREGHEAEIIAIPYKWYPPERILDHMLACRLIDLTESEGKTVDRLIGLKFPAYFIPHPKKALWILHQHRQAYDLWDHPTGGDMIHCANGAQIRDAILRADRELISETPRVYTISQNVSDRMKNFCGVDAGVLYHPPQNADLFHCAEPQPYMFFPSRLWPTKRQALVLEALAHTTRPVQVKFAGMPNHPDYADELKQIARRLGVDDRVQWLGRITEEQKTDLYASSTAVIFPPIDEDYGYVTLEAMLSSKAVITCTDSGGPLEFIEDGATGIAAEPTAHALAAAMDSVWSDMPRTRRWGAAGLDLYRSRNIRWSTVLQTLLG